MAHDGAHDAGAGNLAAAGPSRHPDVLTPFGGDAAHLPLTPHVDERGALVEVDLDALPFTVRRAFWVTDVPVGLQRGGHRHKSAAQVLVCTAGRVEIDLRRGRDRATVVLTPHGGALVLAAGIWAAQRYLTQGSTLLVLASESFDPTDYDTTY